MEDTLENVRAADAVPAQNDVIAGAVPNAVQEDWSGDDALLVEFFRSPADDVDYLRIRIPGTRLEEPVFVASDYYKTRFAAQWQAYKNNVDQTAGQTPLNQCAWMDEGTRLMLAQHHCTTAEQLAQMSDANLSRLGPGMLRLRDRARDDVATRRKAADFDAMDEKMAQLQKMVQTLEAKLAEQEPAEKKAQVNRGAKRS